MTPSDADRRDLVLLLQDLRQYEDRLCLTFVADGGHLAWTVHLPSDAPGILRQRLADHWPALTRLMGDVLTERCLEHEPAAPLWERMLTRAMLARDMAEAPQLVEARALLSQSHGLQEGERMLAAVLLALRASGAV